MTKYKNFKYYKESTGWWIVFPSKFKSFLNGISENEVKKVIDDLIISIGPVSSGKKKRSKK